MTFMAEHAERFDAPVTGPARVAGNLRELTMRARPGDILIIDILDLREVDADALAATKPAAVINAQRTASGRQPAAGARRLLDAGVPVIDGAGAAVLAVRDGSELTLHGGDITRGAAVIARGTALTHARVVAADTAAVDHLKVQVAVFGSHALERLERESGLFFEGKDLPSVGEGIAGRVVLVVSASDAAAADLESLKLFIADRRPFVIAEGGAVEACTAAKLRPSVIIGDLDRAPDAALATARVIALPGDGAVVTRLDALNARYETADIALSGTDLGTLIAHHGGAEAVVVAGRRTAAVDVLSADPETGIGGFLTSLVTRRTAVDATVIAATYRHRHSALFVWTVLGLAVATLAAAVFASDDARGLLTDAWDAVLGWFGGES